MKLSVNVGTWDQWLRCTVGLLLVILAGLGEVAVGWGVVGAVLALSGAFRFCPAYRMLGISTAGSRVD